MATAYGKVGVEGAASTVVEQTNTAKTMKSGSLDVFSTPSMVALMEEAACNALRVPDGFSSVGIAISGQVYFTLANKLLCFSNDRISAAIVWSSLINANRQKGSVIIKV